jgi:epoxyqueuosine reductase
MCGIAPAGRLDTLAAPFDRWLARGYDSGMEYMRRNTDKRLDPTTLVEGAKTVVVCAVNYKNSAWEYNKTAAAPKIASYAYAPDYHDTIKRMLQSVLDALRIRYPELQGRCFTDTAPIFEKAWAVEAGLGWIGRNSLLITHEYGSSLLLGELLLDAVADAYDEPFTGDGCGDCHACVDACPCGAITEERVLDTGKCISRLTIERLPDGAKLDREGLHGWIFGCDECQYACPYNADTPQYANAQFKPVIEPSQVTESFWSALDGATFDRLFGRTPLKRSKERLL